VAGIGNIVSGDEDPWKPSRTIERVSEEPGTTEEIPEAEGEEQAAEEWWQADGMPWKHKPGRADIACMVWIGIYSVYGLATLPLRGLLFGSATEVLAMITGGRVSVAASGALAGVESGSAPDHPTGALDLVLVSLMELAPDDAALADEIGRALCRAGVSATALGERLLARASL